MQGRDLNSHCHAIIVPDKTSKNLTKSKYIAFHHDNKVIEGLTYYTYKILKTKKGLFKFQELKYNF